MQSFLIPIMYLRTAYGAWFPHQECLHILIRLTNAPQAKACRRIVHLPGGHWRRLVCGVEADCSVGDHVPYAVRGYMMGMRKLCIPIGA